LNQIDVWYDEWELKWGDSIIKKIQEGIIESSFLAIVLSPNSVTSKWVNEELNAALMIQLEKQSVFVLPIMYIDCAVPMFLRDKKYVDFRVDYEKGLQDILESIKKLRGEPVYLHSILRSFLQKSGQSISQSVLIEIMENIEKIEIDKTTFDSLFKKVLMTNLFLEPLFSKGLEFYTPKELVRKNNSLRPLPFPEHSDFSIKYALDTTMIWRDICKYCGYSPHAKAVDYSLLRKTVDVLTNLYNIGNGQALDAIICLLGDFVVVSTKLSIV
jgi:hypothetical protein